MTRPIQSEITSRWRGLLATAALAAVAFATAAPAQQEPLSLPPFDGAVAEEFRAVGRVNRSGFNTKGSCTGTLIRPDVVLTAGHCASPVKEDGRDQRMFIAGWARGDYVAARKIVRAVRHPAYHLIHLHNPNFDVGLLYLDRPITEVAPIPMAPSATDRVVVAGYHHLVPHLLSGRLDCPVLNRNTYLLRIDCPVISGNSGGPVLEPDGEGGWQVTAVVSSQEKSPGRIRALAVQIPQWVHDTLAEP